MIKAEVDHGIVKCTLDGTLNAIIADLLLLINSVYNDIGKKNMAVAEATKQMIKLAITDDTCPVWQVIEKKNNSIVAVDLQTSTKFGVVQLKGTE